VPKCQKIQKGELDQYGPEHFEVYPVDTTGLERVNKLLFDVSHCALNALSTYYTSEIDSILP